MLFLCVVIKAGESLIVLKGRDNCISKRSSIVFFKLIFSFLGRSSLREGLDKTTYGAFVDLDPLREKITLRSLV